MWGSSDNLFLQDYKEQILVIGAKDKQVNEFNVLCNKNGHVFRFLSESNMQSK